MIYSLLVQCAKTREIYVEKTAIPCLWKEPGYQPPDKVVLGCIYDDIPGWAYLWGVGPDPANEYQPGIYTGPPWLQPSFLMFGDGKDCKSFRVF